MIENNQSITLYAPATIANLVCGFDVLGMAINEPFDRITVSISDRPGIHIHHTDAFNLPEDPTLNVAGVALKSMLDQMKEPPGFDVTMHKNIMPGSGLGSSAASAMGVVAAANKLSGGYFSQKQLLQFAAEGEKLAGGIAHADNVAPCLLGGITLNCPGFEIHSIPAPSLFVTVLHPQIEIKTSDARMIIKKEITLKKAITQWTNIAGLITGFFKNDHQLISASLCDVIFEPARSVMIPEFAALRLAGKNAGALGGGIAGSGPSVFMLSASEDIAFRVEAAMRQIYQFVPLEFKTYVTTIKSTPLL